MAESRLSTANPQSTIPITVVLLESQPFALAATTDAPFWLAAAQGKVPKAVLSKWLSQTRLVTQAQISLLGALLARVDLPYIFVSDENKATSVRWRVVNILSEALGRTHQDLAFYEDVAKRYDLSLDFPPRPDVYFTADAPAKQFIDLFRAFWTDPTMALLEGLVLFWSILHCQLASFKYVEKCMDPAQRPMAYLDNGAVTQEFVPYWTDIDRDKFIAEVAEVTNMLSQREGGWRRIPVFKAVWQHVLDVERKMLPEM